VDGIVIRLTGRTAWITGAASGIGAAAVALLRRAGARVAALDAAFEDGAEDDGVRRVRLDVRRTEDVTRCAAELGASGWAPDILVNNAGIARDGMVWKLSDSDWADVLDVNLGGAFRMTRACAPFMRARRGGVIVNISSINGLRGKAGQANYAASKAGLIGFTKSVARELARDGVRVNGIAPGFVETPLTARLPPDVRERARAEILLGRFAAPEDIAQAVLFLASPMAAHVTGQVLVVDGGQLL